MVFLKMRLLISLRIITNKIWRNLIMLQCKNVTKKYMKMTAVNGVSIDFMPGRIYALLGSNGSGKTTLMKMIAGLVKPTSGDITLSGVPIGVETKKHIAYMPTESYFYNYMAVLILENIMLISLRISHLTSTTTILMR